MLLGYYVVSQCLSISIHNAPLNTGVTTGMLRPHENPQWSLRMSIDAPFK